MLQEEFQHIRAGKEKYLRIGFGNCGGRIRSTIEDGNLGQHSTRSLNVNGLLSPLKIDTHRANGSAGNNEQSLGSVTGGEEDISRCDAAFACTTCQLEQRVLVEAAEDGGLREKLCFLSRCHEETCRLERGVVMLWVAVTQVTAFGASSAYHRCYSGGSKMSIRSQASTIQEIALQRLTPETQVREIVLETPSAIPLLEKLGIDYCCGGARSLAAACDEKGLEVAAVLEELAGLQREPAPAQESWRTAPLPDLIRYVVEHHHAFAREQMEMILPLAERVAKRHGAKYPDLPVIAERLSALDTELAHHFACEENILFPAILRLDAGHSPLFPPVFGNLRQPIERMLRDHDLTGEELRTLRAMTDDLQPPEEACFSWRALYGAISELESDLHQHIHLENNILFPRALQSAQGVA